MKIRFNRILSFICAVMMICAVCAWAYAEEASATPTDLSPAEETVPAEQEPAEEPEIEPAAEPEVKPTEVPKEETAEEPITSVEVVITKTLAIGGSWEGKVSKTKPAILKLDVKQRCTVHVLVEGKDVWASVEKADHRTDNPPRIQTDPDTDRTIISLEAEEGSYLITLGPVETNLLGIVSVTFMDSKTFTEWEAAQAENEPEPEIEQEPEQEQEPVQEPESDPEDNSEETPEEEPGPTDENVIPDDKDVIKDNIEDIPSDEDAVPDEEDIIPSDVDDIPSETEEAPQPQRHIDVELIWDSENPVLGDTAHLKATLNGYDSLIYTLQWQYSPDAEHWTDAPGETKDSIDIVTSEENNYFYWRILVYIEEAEE